ncbi:MAG: S1 RNA-binding domain-containing protein [Candidatus Aenigmarchaeota archaeon]|nr:S1 RNA-binding domain-containing protein [Candidatus Aenigmarchaeota archaeon]
MKKKYPEEGEIVIGKVTFINPYSVFVKLKDYDTDGMVHISEVARGWIRDIRRHVKKGQTVIMKVLHVDEKKGHVSLSIKRVSTRQAFNKIKEEKLDERAKKMLEIAKKKIGAKDSELREVEAKLKDKFGSLSVAFEKSVKKPAILSQIGIPEKWEKLIAEIAAKNVKQKEFEFKANLSVRSYEPNGVDIIKKILMKAESLGLDVSYISSPDYLIKFKTKNPKKGEQEFQNMLESVRVFGEKKKAIVAFERIGLE